MIETLIELCENEVPVNLKSLCNTLNEEIDKHYINYSPFKLGISGGLFIIQIGKYDYYIYYVPCDKKLYTRIFSNCSLEDDVYIVQIYRSSYGTYCNNEKYCHIKEIAERFNI